MEILAKACSEAAKAAAAGAAKKLCFCESLVNRTPIIIGWL